MLILLKYTPWFGSYKKLNARQLSFFRWKGGLSFALYCIVFTEALNYIPASHVALYLGISPLWGLAWEGRPTLTLSTAKKYVAAILAVAGVTILFLPSLKGSDQHAPWYGELLGLFTGFWWTFYAKLNQGMTEELSGAEITAHGMWQSSFWLAPLMVWELFYKKISYTPMVFAAQAYAVLGGGVAAYLCWYTALRYWSTSRVLLFYNLIAPSTMIWAYLCIGERLSSTFGIAMVLVGSGILILEWNNVKALLERGVPLE